MENLGLYIHIPFCVHKCAYCDFYSLTSRYDAKDYAEALITQIKSCKKIGKNYFVDTIYIGGGTPSCIDPELIYKILDTVKSVFCVSPDAEITIEANPGTLESSGLSTYHSAGVNRLSIGLQSSDEMELKLLSRIHTWKDFESTFILARLEGFDNINVDIMYALPAQTRERLAKTLSDVIALSPDHISFYGLKIEENTLFGQSENIKKALPDEELQYKMYMESAETLEKNGYMQYEISNFAKKGKECRHNLKYWHCKDYIGFGVAAASLFKGRLFSYVKNLDLFLLDPLSPELVAESERLSQKDLANQYIMLSLRLTEGANRMDYARDFGGDLDKEYAQKLQPFIDKKLAERTPSGFRLTRRGMLVSNYILSEIIDF